MDQTIRSLLTQKKYYSTTNIARVLGETRKKVNWYMFNHPDDYSLVNPVEVGSGKCKVMVWKLTQQAK